MASIRTKLVFAAVNRAFALTDYDVQDSLEKQHKFRKKVILDDESLTNDEKSEAIKISTKDFDEYKLIYNVGTKRICENCHDKCLATSYCEYCIRSYLKEKFSNWTSGSDNIDDLIRKCQLETISPSQIIEWIPYDGLQNIEYLTKGGFSEIYTADWIDGHYSKWDSKEKQLKRAGKLRVVLKKLQDVEGANRSWLEEGESHLNISNKYSGLVVSCYGLTKNPSSDGDYMLVMSYLDMNLRNYLQKNHNKLTWKERIEIVHSIAHTLSKIHEENAIHRDLHSGNILYGQIWQRFLISDLGFCGPADKPLNNIYGNLRYIAPEVISMKETTFASDIYSVGMLMWEISSGQQPFIDFRDDYDLAIRIIKGMRPKIMPETPLEYKKLMKQCWDADPTKRPSIRTFVNEILNLRYNLYQNTINESRSETNDTYKIDTSDSSSIYRLFTSKVYLFENFPEPRNATEEEQEELYSKVYSFVIPDNIDGLSNKKNTSKLSGIFKGFNTRLLYKVFNRNTNKFK